MTIDFTHLAVQRAHSVGIDDHFAQHLSLGSQSRQPDGRICYLIVLVGFVVVVMDWPGNNESVLVIEQTDRLMVYLATTAKKR